MDLWGFLFFFDADSLTLPYGGQLDFILAYHYKVLENKSDCQRWLAAKGRKAPQYKALRRVRIIHIALATILSQNPSFYNKKEQGYLLFFESSHKALCETTVTNVSSSCTNTEASMASSSSLSLQAMALARAVTDVVSLQAFIHPC